jgi:hypothetical protein
MADEGKSKAAALAASLPPPDQLGKSDSGGGGMTPVEEPIGDVDPGKMAALSDFEAAAPGSPERLAALDDLIYLCIQKHMEKPPGGI